MLIVELLHDEASPAQRDGHRAALVRGRNSILSDGTRADLMNPKLAVQSAFTSPDSITAGKPCLEDHTVRHPNQGSYRQVTALEVLLQLGQILNFNKKFLTMTMIHIEQLAANRVCAALKVVLGLCSVTSNVACSVTVNKSGGELGTTASDLRSIIHQLNAMS